MVCINTYMCIKITKHIQFLDPQVGKCCYLRESQSIIFYLVTKPRHFHRPTYNTFENSLRNMRDLCDRYKVTELAMSKIGCGLDELDWKLVSRIIDKVFENSNIKIIVYELKK